ISSLVVTVVLLALLRKPFGSKRSQKKRHEPPVEAELIEPAYPTPPLPGQPLVPATKEAANG
ncbi:MAG TPA: NADH-quinone oxidoreductase subunit H, partial [Mycobacterium sp.]|nr:NADH-quinone oxidoreductase subunit H [Mycobacterium sp.]